MAREHIGGRIFIGGLDHNCDEEVLEKAFSIFGRVVQVMVMRDRETNRSRGFAFMSFEDQSAADDAIRRMHGVEIQGRCVTVRKAEKQAGFVDKPRGRGGYRGGGRGGDRNYSDRYNGSSRGQDQYRRPSFDSYRGDTRDGGYGDSRRDTYDDSRRDSYGDSHSNYRSSGYDDRYSDAGYGGVSKEGYSSHGSYQSRQSSNYRGYDSRRVDDNYRYADLRREDSRYDSGARDGYSDRTYDSQMRMRSRSPITRSSYREQSPPKLRRLEARREYTPPLAHGGERMTREFSPPGSSRRPLVSRSMSGREYSDASYRRHSPGDSRKKVREFSPKEYSSKYMASRDLSPSKERGAYAGSRATMQSRSPMRKTDYSSRRDSGYVRSSRETYDDGDAKEYTARGSGSYNSQERGSGI